MGRRGVLVALVALVALAGCGGSSGDQTLPSSTITTVLDVKNRNDRSSALGRLCWARREIALGLNDVVAAVLPYQRGDPVDQGRFGRGVQRLQAAVAVATADLAPDPSLPPTVQDFRAALVDAAARARAVLDAVPDSPSNGQASGAYDDLGASLNVAALPGFAAYADAAAASPSCPDP